MARNKQSPGKSKILSFPFEKGVAEEIIIAPQAQCDKGCNAIFLRQSGGRVNSIDILFFGHLIYSFPLNNTDIRSRSLGALSKDGRRIIYIPFSEKEPVLNNRNTSLVKSYLECLRDTAEGSFPVFRKEFSSHQDPEIKVTITIRYAGAPKNELA